MWSWLHVKGGVDTQMTLCDLRRRGECDLYACGNECSKMWMWTRITLIGAGADVVTVTAADASDHVPGMLGGWTYIERL